MQRVTITLEDELGAAFDSFRAQYGYGNRSEAVRDLIRERLGEERRLADPDTPCLAALSYVFNHHVRDLAARLTDAQHQHHGLAISSMHVHLDHDYCLETVILRGPAAEVEDFANAIIAQPGVRHGQLHLLPFASVEGQDHATGHPPAQAHDHHDHQANGLSDQHGHHHSHHGEHVRD